MKHKNAVQLSGRVESMHYKEDENQLHLVLGVYQPGRANKAADHEKRVIRDYPSIVFYGEQAKELKDTLKLKDRITVTGHLATEEHMVWQGNGLYRKVWVVNVIPEEVFPCKGRDGCNSVTLCGKVIRYRENKDQKYYSFTIRVNNEDGTSENVQFTYFDLTMSFAPKEGEDIYMNGVVRTRSVEIPGTSDDNGRPKTRKVTTVNAKNISKKGIRP